MTKHIYFLLTSQRLIFRGELFAVNILHIQYIKEGKSQKDIIYKYLLITEERSWYTRYSHEEIKMRSVTNYHSRPTNLGSH